MDPQINNEDISNSDEVTTKSNSHVWVRWLIVIVLIVILGSLYAYFYQVQTQESPEVSLDVPPPVVTTPVETIDANFAEERLQEIDQGQGLVGIYLKDGRDLFLTEPINGRSLYHRIEGFCTDECLQSWVPLSGSEAFEGVRLRSVLVNEELSLHYVLLDDKMLFTYVGDKHEGDTNGSDVDAVWEIARP